jgi:hypothetical protein
MKLHRSAKLITISSSVDYSRNLPIAMQKLRRKNRKLKELKKKGLRKPRIRQRENLLQK